MTGSVSFHMLPAADGDCLLVQALDASGSPTTTILVDGGREDTYARWKPIIRKLVGPSGTVDLVVVTHIDADHIGGILEMLCDPERGFDIGGIWFNGHPQVVAAQVLKPNLEAYGVVQADELSRIVEALKLQWNAEFAGGPIHSGMTAKGPAVGAFSTTVVTPARGKLAAMLGPWTKAWKDAKAREEKPAPVGVERFGGGPPDVGRLAATRDESDAAKPNGSSIGLLLEAFGRRLLLVGDCHPADLTMALTALAEPQGSKVTVDVLKVSHHGARTNTTSALMKAVQASVYAFSTDGSRHAHPDEHAVAKVIVSGGRGKTLAFNYNTSRTERWHDERLRSEFGYEVQYPDEKHEGYLRIDLPGV